MRGEREREREREREKGWGVRRGGGVEGREGRKEGGKEGREGVHGRTCLR